MVAYRKPPTRSDSNTSRTRDDATFLRWLRRRHPWVPRVAKANGDVGIGHRLFQTSQLAFFDADGLGSTSATRRANASG